MTLQPINPIEIQRNQGTLGSAGKAKAMEFGDFLGGVSALTPFATEFTAQATGNVNAATVLNAAFASFPGAASSFSGGGGAPSWSSAGFSPYGLPPGLGGLSNNYAGGGGMAQTVGMPNYPYTGGGANSPAVPGTGGAMSQQQLMETMNQNNLQLIELQAMMQSNMQVWNTKSNILSADHRAKLSMIEKFTAR